MSLKVLLLEDDASLTRELEHALAERAYEVTTISDAEQGFGLAASRRFDVVLLSNELSGGIGLGLSERMRRDPATAGVPLVVMSRPVVIQDVMASLPMRSQAPPPPPVPAGKPSVIPSMAPSGDLRETIKNQARTVQQLRADLASRSQTIDRLTAKVKELTQKLTETLTLLDAQQGERAQNFADLETLKETHAARIAEVEAVRGARIAELEAERDARVAELLVLREADALERERAHAEETAFLERAHEEASDAASRRLKDSERHLAVERATHAADAEAHAAEIATFREIVANLERERDTAIAERDEARTQIEAHAMDVAQAQMDLAEVTRARSADAQAHAAKIIELEDALATRTATDAARINDQEARLGSVKSLEGELAAKTAKVAELAQALETAEREAAQQQLARDAAFHDMSLRAASDLEAAVKAVKEQAALEREELMRGQEAAIKVARDKAIAQALAVARERKKQQ